MPGERLAASYLSVRGKLSGEGQCPGVFSAHSLVSHCCVVAAKVSMRSTYLLGLCTKHSPNMAVARAREWNFSAQLDVSAPLAADTDLDNSG
jgi:hypothetical protein